MSRRQSVLVTAVPRGYVEAGTVELAAAISPRLSHTAASATLADFADWQAWYAQQVGWEVSFGGSSTYTEAEVVSEPDPGDLWRDLFPADTRVASFTGDPGPARTAYGYSYRTLAEALRECYQASDLRSTPLAGAVERGLPVARAGTAPTQSVVGAVQQYLGFWQPVGDFAPEPGALRPDFHERLSLLGDHPGLLEALRLVVRLRVRTPRTGPGTSVRLRMLWTPPSGTETRVVTPATRLQSGSGVFAAALRTLDGRHDDRLRLDLQNEQVYSVHSLDVDASVAQVISVVRGRPGAGSVAAPSVPSARGGGLTLAMNGRMQLLQDRLTKGRQSALSALATPETPPAAYAEDLIVGHHLQVGVGPEGAPAEDLQWFGLAHRHTVYRTANAGLEVTDEAPMTMLARRRDPSEPSRLLVSDVMARWDGWSLAVPHPAAGQLLQEDPTSPATAPEEGRPGIAGLSFVTSLPAQTADRRDARLPALRFGAWYSFRGRAVDLSGGAPAWDDAPATRPTQFLRWEAAAAPLVLPPPALTRTEHALRMVVRSDPRSGTKPGRRSGRTIAPPRVSVDLGLRHGVFDEPDGSPSASAHDKIVRLDAIRPGETSEPLVSDFPAPMRIEWLPDPMTTDVHLDVEHLQSCEASFVPSSDPDPLGVASIGGWLAVGLSLSALGPGTASVLGPVAQLAGGRRVQVRLRPGARARVQVRSIPRGPRAAQHGVVGWLPGNLSARLDRLSRQGVPAVNPDRELELVHAVRQPLHDPEIVSLLAIRSAGQQNPVVNAGLLLDDETSGRVTLTAAWEEWRDAGPALRDDEWSAPERAEVERTALLDVDLAPVTTPASAPTSLPRYGYERPLVLPDLRRRDVTITATTTSRFVEEWRAPITASFVRVPALFGPRYLVLPPDVDLESVTLSAGGDRLALGEDYEVATRPDTGRRTLRLTASYDGASPTVEGVRGTVLAVGVPRTVVVPSAVRPAPPTLVHALPAWQARDGYLRTDGQTAASRGGSRLRLYLERPWWSSGDGEQLAVVVSHDHMGSPGFAEDTTLLSRAVTRYGLDPTLKVGTTTPLTASLASGTVVTAVPVTDELGVAGPVLATIAAHDVSYSEERDLYVAEVAFPDKPAGTFVRLTVARYQPEVGTDVPRLSQLVTLDPVQLLPRRSVLVSNTTNGRIRASVTGAVHAGEDVDHAPQLRVSVQRQVRDAGPDLGWDTVATAVTTAVAGKFPALQLSRDPSWTDGHRVLVEEVERWKVPGGSADPDHVPVPASGSAAIADLQGERVTWVATLPMPTNGL